jgi:transcription initiation factor TFIIH subunit 4
MFQSRGTNNNFGVIPTSQDKHHTTIQMLDKHARNSWENVLHYLVGISGEKKPMAFVQLLEKSGLMSKQGSVLQITSKGFQFLLQDMHVQVWALLLQYLELSPSLQMDASEVLNFLFQLASLELGQVFNINLGLCRGWTYADPETHAQRFEISWASLPEKCKLC